jgi:integrase/recombinase XerD
VDLLPARTGRATPYLYSDADVAALMAAAGRLRSPLAAATMQTFIGLVFATGLRRGEALGLDRGDFDPATGVLTIREAKFHKPRQLPVHPSTAAALTAYAARRDRLCPRPRTGALLVSTTGAPTGGPPRCRRRSGRCCARPGSGNTARRVAPAYSRRPAHLRGEHFARLVSR